MTAYDASQWTDLFVATAGASAALAGLVFVAVSINLERILSYEGLPERALETLLLLVGVLVFSILALMPGQSAAALGTEVLVLGLLLLVAVFRLPAPMDQETGREPAHWRVGRLVVRAAGTLPFVIGGLTLLLESGGGLYWVAAGIICAIAGGVTNAWVLLIEILR